MIRLVDRSQQIFGSNKRRANNLVLGMNKDPRQFLADVSSYLPPPLENVPSGKPRRKITAELTETNPPPCLPSPRLNTVPLRSLRAKQVRNFSGKCAVRGFIPERAELANELYSYNDSKINLLLQRERESIICYSRFIQANYGFDVTENINLYWVLYSSELLRRWGYTREEADSGELTRACKLVFFHSYWENGINPRYVIFHRMQILAAKDISLTLVKTPRQKAKHCNCYSSSSSDIDEPHGEHSVKSPLGHEAKSGISQKDRKTLNILTNVNILTPVTNTVYSMMADDSD